MKGFGRSYSYHFISKDAPPSNIEFQCDENVKKSYLRILVGALMERITVDGWMDG